MNTMQSEPRPSVTLRGETAAELMTANPVSINEGTTVQQAMDLLTRKGVHAAAVIDEAGHPVGVLSGTDILIHVCEQAKLSGKGAAGDDTTVAHDMMTPAVFSVGLQSPASCVIGDMVALGVHQLFVVDDAGILVGVISALDLVKHLAA